MRFPTLDEAIAFNEAVRDPTELPESPDDSDEIDRLERALARAGTATDVIEGAAVLLFEIASAQAFFEGNKRTAFLLPRWFLDINGVGAVDVVIPRFDPELGDLLGAAARGGPVRAEIVELLRGRAVA